MAPRHKTPSKKERRLGYYIANKGVVKRVKSTGKGSTRERMWAKAVGEREKEVKTAPKSKGELVSKLISRLSSSQYINNRKLWLANLDAYVRFITANLGGNKFRKAVAQLKILKTKKALREEWFAKMLESRIKLLESLREYMGEIETAMRTRNKGRLEALERTVEEEILREGNPARKMLLKALLIRIRESVKNF
jgi:hypothetical protein